MITVAAVVSAIKAASNAFQKLSEKERLAALAQAQLLEDAADDLLELTDELNRGGNLDPYLVSKLTASMSAAENFIEIKEVKSQAKAAMALIGQAYTSQQNAVPTGDIRALRELAGVLKGTSRIIRGVAAASKQSGGWL